MRRYKLIGDITQDSYKEFSEFLDEMESKNVPKIHIELFSDGGDAHAALAFFDKIVNSKVNITIEAIGNVASAAVLVLAAGDIRIMNKSAWVMVHEDSGKLTGDVVALERESQQMRRLEDQWATLLASKTKPDAKLWTHLHKKTTYMDSSECLAHGLVDMVKP